MPSSYTDLGIELMATGENSGTWGDKTNTNLNIINQAAAGYQAISIAGGANTTTLGIQDGSSDLTGNTNAARNLIIELTGTITGNQVVTVPNSVEKSYIISNGTTGAFTVEFKTATGTGVTFATTDKGTRLAYADGTNVVDVNAAFTTISQFSLPTADGTADQALITDASGNLSFSGPFATNGKAIAFAIVF
jgi:trimeric autotransporter adhesin